MKILLTTIGAVLWFIISISPVHAQIGHDSIDWEAVDSAFYEQYEPEIPPQWLFPIIFEEGRGMRDTVYLGYHEDAYGSRGGEEHEQYGEIFTSYDTSEFNAGWRPMTENSTLNVRVSSKHLGTISGSTVNFHKGQYPLFIYWDVKRLDDPSLPFEEDEETGHLAAAFINWGPPGTPIDNETNSLLACNFKDPVTILRTPTYRVEGCYAEDSLYFEDQWQRENITAAGVGISITQYPPKLGTFIEEPGDLNEKIKVYPNPVRDKATLIMEEDHNGIAYLYSYTGKELKRKPFNQVNKVQFNLDKFPPGSYSLVIIRDNAPNFSKTLILTH